MELSIFLAQLLGMLLVIIGLAVLTHRKMWLSIMKDFMSRKALFYTVAWAEVVVGLFIVLSHNLWVSDWRVAITIIGWLALLEGLLYILSSVKTAKDLIRSINVPRFYNLFGLIAMVVGFWLAYHGFSA